MQFNKSRRAALKLILLLAWPTVLEEILQTAVQYVDSAMVGRVGARATAAVGATTTVSWLIGSSIHALSIGFLAYISKEMGAGRRQNTRRACAQASLAALTTGLLFTVLALGLSSRVPVWMNAAPDILEDASRYFFILYTPMLFRAFSIIFGTCLRAAGDTKTPLKVNMIMNAVNIALNFLLIYPTRTVTVFSLSFTMPGAGWGVAGAAAASAVSVVISGIGMIIAVLKHRMLSPVGLSLKPDPEILKPCLKVALPCALQRFGTSFGYVAFASMINSLGTISTAAHSIANTAESAFYIPGYGMQTAAATLVGNCYGANDKEAMRRICRTMIGLEIFLMVLSGSALFIGATGLMGLFTADAQVIVLGSTVLRMVAVSEPAYGIAIIMEGIFQGVGDTKYAFFCGVSGMWCIRILGTYFAIYQFGLGLTAAWGCMIAHNLVLSALLLIRYLRGKWNPLHETEVRHELRS